MEPYRISLAKTTQPWKIGAEGPENPMHEGRVLPWALLTKFSSSPLPPSIHETPAFLSPILLPGASQVSLSYNMFVITQNGPVAPLPTTSSLVPPTPHLLLRLRSSTEFSTQRNQDCMQGS